MGCGVHQARPLDADVGRFGLPEGVHVLGGRRRQVARAAKEPLRCRALLSPATVPWISQLFLPSAASAALNLSLVRHSPAFRIPDLAQTSIRQCALTDAGTPRRARTTHTLQKSSYSPGKAGTLVSCILRWSTYTLKQQGVPEPHAIQEFSPPRKKSRVQNPAHLDSGCNFVHSFVEPNSVRLTEA